MSEASDLVRRRLLEAAAVVAAIAGDQRLAAHTVRAAEALVRAYRAGGKAIFMGNGGSAADASHLAAEFLGRYLLERRPLPALALTDNSATISAIGNDYGFGDVFSRQVEAFARPGDVVVGLSTSGASPNVILGLARAQDLGVVTIGMTGESRGQVAKHCDHLLAVPSSDTPRIQEGHAILGHTLCEIVERAMRS